MQRFGTGSTPTNSIGRHLLRGSWEEAIRLIIGGAGGDRFPDLSAARARFFNDLDADAALRAVPNYPPGCFPPAERLLLEQLRRNPRDPVGAIEAMPRNLRMLYIHAYQVGLASASQPCPPWPTVLPNCADIRR